MLKLLGLQWDPEVPLTRENNPFKKSVSMPGWWNFVFISIILHVIYSYSKVKDKTNNLFSKTYLPTILICVGFILFGYFVMFLVNSRNKSYTKKYVNRCFEEQNCTFQRVNPCGWQLKRDGVIFLAKKNDCYKDKIDIMQ